jgi:glutamate decarboxylase
MAPNEVVTPMLQRDETCREEKTGTPFYKDLLPLATDSNTTVEFIDDVTKKLVQFLKDSNDRSNKVAEFIAPEDLKKKIDFTLQENPQTRSEVMTNIDGILKYAVKTGHARYFNQLWAGVDTSALMGQWIAATTNTSMFTYEVAPVYLVMEHYVLQKLLSYAGFTNGDGLTFPGGSMSNMSAMNIARYKFCPDIKRKGIFGMSKKLVAYSSEESHYSLVKAAGVLGIGMDNVVKIKTDGRGKMIVDDLRSKIKESIEQGDQPFFVNATSGTTVLGAYDPINKIADICEEFKVWMHVDASWGGGCLVSSKHRHLMEGCSRADSMTWNPHKLLNCLQQCSFLLVKEKGWLMKANSSGASYLFQKDKKLYDVKWDTGDKTFQCGRNNDILKLWLMWKTKGSSGMERQVDTAFSNARYLADQVKIRKNFVLYKEPECTNTCFYYVPPSIACMEDGPEKNERLDKVPPEIKRQLTLAGAAYIGYQPLKQHFNFFRMINVSPAVTFQDMDYLLDQIETYGKDL